MQFKEYVRVTTLADALAMASQAEESTLYYAGGTDILINSRAGEPYRDRYVIDIFDVDELRGIEEFADHLRIGSMTTHTQIARSPLIQQYAGVLGLASATVGSLQIQNHATIGGNIANASPAADSFAALAVLDGRIEIRRGEETLCLPLYDLVTGPYQTSLKPADLITAILVTKQPEGSLHDFYKLGRRRALAISRMAIATVLALSDQGEVTHFEMTLGATFPRPQRFDDISAMLKGKIPTEEDLLATAKALSDKIPEIAGIRPSTSYKQPVANRLILRILRKLILGQGV